MKACLPDKRADGLSQQQLNDRREWLLTAIGVEAARRGEAWQKLYEWWLDRGERGRVTLVEWFSGAAGPLNSAVLHFANPNIDLTLMVERYVNAIYGHFNREGELPSPRQLLASADAAVTD